MIGLRLILAKG